MDTTFITDAVATLRCVARSLDPAGHHLPETLWKQMSEAMDAVQLAAAQVGELLVDIEVWNRQNG